VLVSERLALGSAEAKVLAAVSTVTPVGGDKRFADAAWQHPGWQRLAQSYVGSRPRHAWCR
jgi:hypothetical protein